MIANIIRVRRNGEGEIASVWRIAVAVGSTTGQCSRACRDIRQNSAQRGWSIGDMYNVAIIEDNVSVGREVGVDENRLLESIFNRLKIDDGRAKRISRSLGKSKLHHC